MPISVDKINSYNRHFKDSMLFNDYSVSRIPCTHDVKNHNPRLSLGQHGQSLLAAGTGAVIFSANTKRGG